ncbi:MAG: hypothetical protein PVI71_00740 [Desulfobacterales bacterium]|jgi:hypothetical protein
MMNRNRLGVRITFFFVWGCGLLFLGCWETEAGRTARAQQSQIVSRQSTVDWKAAQQHALFDDSRLTKQQARALKKAALPLLLPNKPELIATGIMTAGPSWYAVSMKHEGVSVVVSGSTRHVTVPGAEATNIPELRKQDLRVVRAEGIVELAFRAYGAIYTISVECADPATDPHCKNDDYILELADKLLRSRVNHN